MVFRQVVLMKGHGMAVRGFSVRDAVFRSFYTLEDATVQLQARLLGGGPNTGLTPREAMDAENTTESDSLCDYSRKMLFRILMFFKGWEGHGSYGLLRSTMQDCISTTSARTRPPTDDAKKILQACSGVRGWACGLC